MPKMLLILEEWNLHAYSTAKPQWCSCGVCRPMPTLEENKCCGKIKCVISYITSQNVCTDRDVLIMAIRGRCDIRAEHPDYSTNSFRKADYRQYILWRYKKLERGNRKVCPSCVVLTIGHINTAQKESSPLHTSEYILHK